MENVCVANAHAVWRNPGRYVMCGCDHLINGDLDKMFDGKFDIGIMLVKDKVNNTVVLVDSDNDNHSQVEEFFQERVKTFEKLSSKMKRLSLIHISEPTRRTPISYAVFCLKKKSRPSE